MRTTVLAVFVVAATAGAVPGQLHPNGYAAAADRGQVILYTPPSAPVTLSTGGRRTLGLTMDASNRELLASDWGGTISRIDPVTRTVLGTLTAGLPFPNKMTVGGDGALFVTTPAAIVRFPRGSGAPTTLLNGLTNLGGGLVVDVDTGDFLVQSAGGIHPLYRVSRDGRAVSTVGVGFEARYAIDRHVPSGVIFGATCCSSRVLHFLPPGSTLARVFHASAVDPIGVEALRVDRASAATQQLVLATYASVVPGRGRGGFFTIDVTTRAVTSLAGTGGVRLFGLELLYRRNVHTLARSRGQWDVGIAIPEDAGAPYRLLIGASGVRPGVRLPGGRVAYLRVDAVTLAGLQHALGPLLTGTWGTLDGGGRATARLDLRGLGSAVNGIRLWFLAVTLSAGAPGGIATVTDPTVLVVEGV